MRWRRRGPLLALSLAISASIATAQARPGTISGTVRGDDGRPLENATVLLDPGEYAKRAFTDAQGRFRLGGVAAGTHRLRTVRVGYRFDERDVDVPDGGLDIGITLTRFTQLDTVPIRAARTGIFGHVLAHADFTPLPDATVTVVGARASARTRADGAFNFPTIREGAYVVNVERKGYASRMISVFVPPDGAIELAAALDVTSAPDGTKLISLPLSEFDARARRRGRLSAIVPRLEFAGRYDVILDDALRFTTSFLKSNLVLDDNACVFVNGVPKPGMTIHEFSAGEIEAVELYGLGQDYTNSLLDRWPPGLPCGNSTVALPPASSRKFGLQPNGVSSMRDLSNDTKVRAIVIWLRK